MPYNLKGRNVLVTGGSRGIGEAISYAFAKEGSNLVINYVSNQSRADGLKDKLLKEYPDLKIFVIQADVGSKVECERLVKESLEVLGGLDVIVSNAGWTQMAKDFSDLEELSEEAWDKVYAVNVKANIWLLNAAKSTFNSNQDGGSLLICASTAGVQAGGGSSMAYNVSKAAALHLMRNLAITQGPKIRVNAICPGLVLTEWGSQFPQQKKEEYLLRTRTNAYPEATDVAEAFVFAAQNVAMTGQKLIIDSGFVIHN